MPALFGGPLAPHRHAVRTAVDRHPDILARSHQGDIKPSLRRGMVEPITRSG